jgi:hypothetical protein
MNGVRSLLNLTLVALAALGSFAPTAGAQSSGMFVREGRDLQVESKQLENKAREIQGRIEAYKSLDATMQARWLAIAAMPAGIGRDAALEGYKRDWKNEQETYTVLLKDWRAFEDSRKDFNRRLDEYKRRVQAARAANRFRPGQRVQVEWPVGSRQWWSAIVLQAENGRYRVTYPGYDRRRWDEWVGPERIR